MKKTILLLLIFEITISYSQIQEGTGVFFAKEYSKNISLFKAKEFLMSSVLTNSKNITEFTITPLAAASSGELTTLIYKCNDKSKNGLILGFYGNYWNKQGVVYQGFGFKNLPENKAIEFFNKIIYAIKNHKEFLKSDNDNNNIIFKYDDIDVMIYTTLNSYRIRLLWNGFDSTWERVSFERSKRRFEKNISNGK